VSLGSDCSRGVLTYPAVDILVQSSPPSSALGTLYAGASRGYPGQAPCFPTPAFCCFSRGSLLASLAWREGKNGNIQQRVLINRYPRYPTSPVPLVPLCSSAPVATLQLLVAMAMSAGRMGQEEQVWRGNSWC